MLALVAARRCEDVHALLMQIAPHCRVLMAGSPSEAAARLVGGGVDLVVLDLQCEPEQPLALIHLLARFSSTAVLMAFDRSASQLPILPYDVHPWRDLEPRLRAALDVWKERRSARPALIGTPGSST